MSPKLGLVHATRSDGPLKQVGYLYGLCALCTTESKVSQGGKVLPSMEKLQVLFIGLVLLTLGSTGSCAGAIAGKRRIWYPGSCVRASFDLFFYIHHRQCSSGFSCLQELISASGRSPQVRYHPIFCSMIKLRDNENVCVFFL